MRTVVTFGMTLLLLAACASQDTLGPPITLPHTVTRIGGIELTMNREGERGELVLRASCVAAGMGEQIERVSITVATRSGSTTSSYAFEQPAPCRDGKPFLAHAGSDVGRLQPGERLEIALKVERPSSATGISECYEQGRDGALHQANDPDGCLPTTAASARIT